jgi:hypothetical protein
VLLLMALMTSLMPTPYRRSSVGSRSSGDQPDDEALAETQRDELVNH